MICLSVICGICNADAHAEIVTGKNVEIFFNQLKTDFWL